MTRIALALLTFSLVACGVDESDFPADAVRADRACASGSTQVAVRLVDFGGRGMEGAVIEARSQNGGEPFSATTSSAGSATFPVTKLGAGTLFITSPSSSETRSVDVVCASCGCMAVPNQLTLQGN